jgi:serine/threonine-protein phosphatase 5
VGVQFGPDVAARFLEDNGLKMLVRSHEVKHEGYEFQKGGKVLTIFSAPNYCDQMGNKGAFIRFKGGDMEPKITSFEKVEHPKIPPMAYSSQWNMF